MSKRPAGSGDRNARSAVSRSTGRAPVLRHSTACTLASSHTSARRFTGNSVARVALADSEGAQTQYVAHCLPDDFSEVAMEKPLGEENVLDELILFPLDHRLVIVDSNGVPRAQRRADDRGRTFLRFYPAIGKRHPTASISHVLSDC